MAVGESEAPNNENKDTQEAFSFLNESTSYFLRLVTWLPNQRKAETQSGKLKVKKKSLNCNKYILNWSVDQ